MPVRFDYAQQHAIEFNMFYKEKIMKKKIIKK